MWMAVWAQRHDGKWWEFNAWWLDHDGKMGQQLINISGCFHSPLVTDRWGKLSVQDSLTTNVVAVEMKNFLPSIMCCLPRGLHKNDYQHVPLGSDLCALAVKADANCCFYWCWLLSAFIRLFIQLSSLTWYFKCSLQIGIRRWATSTCNCNTIQDWLLAALASNISNFTPIQNFWLSTAIATQHWLVLCYFELNK